MTASNLIGRKIALVRQANDQIVNVVEGVCCGVNLTTAGASGSCVLVEILTPDSLRRLVKWPIQARLSEENPETGESIAVDQFVVVLN
jgi:hypothetical protein